MGIVWNSPPLLPEQTKKYKKGYYIPSKKSKKFLNCFRKDWFNILCFILCFIIILSAPVYLYIKGVI